KIRKRFVKGHGFTGCGKSHESLLHRGRAALSRRVSRAKSTRALALRRRIVSIQTFSPACSAVPLKHFLFAPRASARSRGISAQLASGHFVQGPHPSRFFEGWGFSRPVLRAVVDAQHVHNLIFNAVDNDVGQAREGQFAGAIDPPLAAAVRKSPQATTALVQRLRHLRGCTRIVFLNVPNNAIEVFGRRCCPAQTHQGCKICFSLAPTSSCSTNSPRSAAARPMFTASMKQVSSSR